MKSTKNISLFILSMLLIGCAALPVKVGVIDDQLLPCPSTPNCVSSFSDSEEHRTEALLVQSNEATLQELASAMKKMPRSELIVFNDRYVHFTFVTPILRFKDDVELLRTDDGKIHIRSASRVGSSDFGVNKARVSKIRELLPRLSLLPAANELSAPTNK